MSDCSNDKLLMQLWLDGAKDGDSKSWELLVKKLWKPINQIALSFFFGVKIANPFEAAHDVTCIVFLYMRQRQKDDDFRNSIQDIRKFFFKTAILKSKEFFRDFRREMRRRNTFLENIKNEIQEDIQYGVNEPFKPTAEEEFNNEEARRNHFNRAVEMMPHKPYQDILLLEAAGCSNGEIAEELGIPKGRVADKKYQAHKAVKKQLKKLLDPVPRASIIHKGSDP